MGDEAGLSPIEAMKAQVRAANQAGTRLDGGGDDRPAVYQREDGTWVYRASAIGKMCERALYLLRTGQTPSPPPEVLQRAFLTSANNEELAIALFEDKNYVEVEQRQRRVDVEVGDGVVISGSIDGVGYQSIMDRWGLVEVKCLGPDYWKRRGSELLGELGWDAQIECYLRGLRDEVSGCWVVFGQKIDDVVENTVYIWVTRKPRLWAQIRSKVARVEAAARDGVMPDCPDEQFGCPFFHLHEGGGEVKEVLEDPAIAKLAHRRAEINRQQKALDDEKQAIGRLLEKELKRLGVESARVTGRGFGRFDLRLRTRTNKRRDWRAMEDDGVDLSKYTTETTTTYVQVDPVGEGEGE